MKVNGEVTVWQEAIGERVKVEERTRHAGGRGGACAAQGQGGMPGQSR